MTQSPQKNPSTRPTAAIGAASWLNKPPADFETLYREIFDHAESWPEIFGYGAIAKVLSTPEHLTSISRDRHAALAATGTAAEHCSECNRPLPPDMTFCPHDGALPAFRSPEFEHDLVARGFVDRASEKRLARLLDVAGHLADRHDIDRVFQKLPATFSFPSRHWHAQVIEHNLRLLGLVGSVERASSSSADRTRQTWRARLTPGAMVSLVAGICCMIAGLARSTYALVVLGLGLTATGYALAARRTHRSLALDREILLHASAGLNPSTLSALRSLTTRLLSHEVRRRLATIALEYHLIASQWVATGATPVSFRNHLDPRLERVIATVGAGLETAPHDAVRFSYPADDHAAYILQLWLKSLDSFVLALNALRRQVTRALASGAGVESLDAEIKALDEAARAVEETTVDRPSDSRPPIVP